MNTFEILDRYSVSVRGRDDDHYECRVELNRGQSTARMAETGIRMITELASALLGSRMEFVMVDGFRIFSDHTPGSPLTVDISISHLYDNSFGVNVEATDERGVIFELGGILTDKDPRPVPSDPFS